MRWPRSNPSARSSVISPTKSASPWQRRGVGRRADSLFVIFAASSGVLILLVLAWMVVSTTGTALPVFGSQGISFVTSSEWSPNDGEFGALAFIYGTVITSVIALIIAIPLSLGVSLFLTEYSPKRLKAPIGYAIDLLAAVPSVIYGLWGVFILLPLFLQPTADFLAKYLGFIPIFKGPASGLSYFGAGVILAVMITPIITSLCREVFATVPNADRHAAYALGATKWEMVRQSVLPRGRAGIVGAIMLGLGRALGETIAVALLIGSAVRIDVSWLRPGYSMAAVIANQFQEATGDHIRALVGIGVVLFALTILINMGARALVWRFNRI
ncbi:MAG: phosphate ABC transporter permease subunit PstC [Thermoleophilia bacterium]|nr:phosphate ABC transporter permease subunit PstC [Thermoleophilia bacterium]